MQEKINHRALAPPVHASRDRALLARNAANRDVPSLSEGMGAMLDRQLIEHLEQAGLLPTRRPPTHN